MATVIEAKALILGSSFYDVASIGMTKVADLEPYLDELQLRLKEMNIEVPNAIEKELFLNSLDDGGRAVGNLLISIKTRISVKYGSSSSVYFMFFPKFIKYFLESSFKDLSHMYEDIKRIELPKDLIESFENMKEEYNNGINGEKDGVPIIHWLARVNSYFLEISESSISSVPKYSYVSKNDLFRNRDFGTDEKLCFVLMPFSSKFSEVWEDVIRPTAEEKGLSCVRADSIYGPRAIIQDIWEHILKSRVLIAELTDKNPNVFYELGLAHAMEKDVILLTQTMEDVPFDLRHLRVIVYAMTPRAILKLRTDLTKMLEAVLRAP